MTGDVTGTTDAAWIDAAWEERVLPALSEYTLSLIHI